MPRIWGGGAYKASDAMREAGVKSHPPNAATYLGAGGGYYCATCGFRLSTTKGGRSRNPYVHQPYRVPERHLWGKYKD